jgi:dolichyl-diphosphooligosaccharide--protein glycosyltransferase
VKPPTALGLGALVGGALLLRCAPPWRMVFRDGFTRFAEHDPWYHVRLVENLIGRSPLPLRFDPYLLHPGGQPVTMAPGLDLLIAAIAWALGWGEPSPRLVEMVAALVPPLLGALVVIPTYYLARLVTGTGGAWLAATLVAVLPGQALQRSALGFVDHHVAEALLTAGVLALLGIALQGLGTEELVERTTSWRGAAIAAGACLALYRVFWAQALMGALLLLVACALVAISVQSGGLPAAGVLRTFAATFAAAGCVLLVVAPVVAGGGRDALVLLVLAASCEAAERGASWARRRRRPALAFAAAAGGLLTSATLVLIARGSGLYAELSSHLQRLDLSGVRARYVGEALPLTVQSPLRFFWSELGAAFVLASAGAVLLAWRARRGGRPVAALLLVWLAGVLAVTVGQVRFAYYLPVPVAVLAALALSRLAATRRAMAAAVAAFLVVHSLVLSIRQMGIDRGPPDAWVEVLQWMRHSTPEPFADPAAYDARYDRERSPRSAYGVLAWWDFGYWITRVARRVPVTNPTQRGAQGVAAFLLAQDESSAERIAGPLGVGYVIVDRSLPVERPRAGGVGSEGMFPALAAWSGEPEDRFFELYDYPQPDGTHREVYLFYPEYYRAMAVRLFAFGGRAVPEARYHVVTWEAAERAGAARKRIVDLVSYARYRDAANAVVLAPAANRRLVGIDPLESCVPLEPLTGYALVHASSQREPTHGGVPAVQVYRRGSS